MGFRRSRQLEGKAGFQQYGLHALDGAECDRRGRDPPPSTLALAGASHIARQRLRTSLEQNISSPSPLPRKHTYTPTANTRTRTCPTHAHAHRRPRLPA